MIQGAIAGLGLVALCLYYGFHLDLSPERARDEERGES